MKNKTKKKLYNGKKILFAENTVIGALLATAFRTINCELYSVRFRPIPVLFNFVTYPKNF